MAEKDNEKIFNEIYDLTKHRVLAFITAKCRNTSDIQDVFQDTYTELFSVICRRGKEYIRKPDSFVMRLARQQLYRHYTLAQRMKSVFSSVWEDAGGDQIELLDLQADDFCLEDAAEINDTVERISLFLSTKPDDIKKIFYLYYYFDMTLAQVAQALSISESNVKHKLYRTLEEMRKLYKYDS